MITSKKFLNWLERAINSVDAGYFCFVERVYCYELYHQLRVQMKVPVKGSHLAQNLFLHSELVKTVIAPSEATRIGVYPLRNRRSPDFILHEPSTTDHQIAAMEVKATSNLSYYEFVDDIQKLSELRTNYNYKLVVFHCINAKLDLIRKHLLRADREGLALDKHVLLVIKPDFHSKIHQVNLGGFS